MKKEKWLIALAAGAGVAAVAYKLLSKYIPEGAIPVQPFDKERYMGTWNEVARMPSMIERNLKDLTEEYILNDDGTMNVVTTAFNTKKNDQTIVTGRMKMAGAEQVGMLKVSYLGPLWLNYNVLAVDADYRYALVSGSGLSYLWILSREKIVPDDIKAQFLATASEIGFAVDKLEWV